ncbi:50S ribosomal protein L21 [bacterium]|nr:50S ribosomal protein L21 [bacterium]MBU1598510.1 50S ribosomal protein L21 [bacterium]
MYAILEDRGRQYIVKEGDRLSIDLEKRNKGDKVEFTNILMVRDEEKLYMGLELSGVKVTGEVLGERKAKKITTVKYRRRKGYRRKIGHRQKYLCVLIKGIELGNRESGIANCELKEIKENRESGEL